MTEWAENVWILSFPLRLLGADMRKNTTVVRLKSGQLILHSGAPFTEADVKEIRSKGAPGWMVESMLRHDTFTRQARAFFPEIPVLAPLGFSKRVDFPVETLIPTPAEWHAEIDVLELQGVPGMRETAMLHRASRTLIVADLAFNFPGKLPLWTRLLMRAAVGKERTPGISRSFRFQMKDRNAFALSLHELLSWDFDRLIVGHGSPIEKGAKRILHDRLESAGYLTPR